MSKMMKIATTALGFALLAAFARHYHLHTQSRLQILAFWGLALFYEVELRANGHAPPSIAGFFVNGCAATSSILAVKFMIEGLPKWISSGLGGDDHQTAWGTTGCGVVAGIEARSPGLDDSDHAGNMIKLST